MITSEGIDQQSSGLRLLLTCGIIGPLLFIVVFLIEGALRADYSPLRHPVSTLSIGERGWIQVASFIITGSLILLFAVGLRRVLRIANGTLWGPLLVALVGIGLIGAGLFTADPLNGYPPGTPLVPVERTTQGTLHDLFGVPVFLGLPLACIVFARHFARRGERKWAVYSALSGLVMFVAFVLAGLGFGQAPGFSDLAGLFQRLSIVTGWTWIVLLAAHHLRTSVRPHRLPAT